jgi:hypothetical protein
MAPIIRIQRNADPEFLGKLLTRHQVNKDLKNRILKALRAYNKTVNEDAKKYEAACNKAADKLENDFNLI